MTFLLLGTHWKNLKNSVVVGYLNDMREHKDKEKPYWRQVCIKNEIG